MVEWCRDDNGGCRARIAVVVAAQVYLMIFMQHGKFTALRLQCESEKLTQLSRLPFVCWLSRQNVGEALVSGYFHKGAKKICALLPELPKCQT